MTNHVFISLFEVQLYVLSYIHLRTEYSYWELKQWQRWNERQRLVKNGFISFEFRLYLNLLSTQIGPNIFRLGLRSPKYAEFDHFTLLLFSEDDYEMNKDL